MTAMPSIFVSHGAPNLVLHPSATRDFLASFAGSLPKPKAIVSVSAHFEASDPVAIADEKPGMIYDLGGFEKELYSMVYPAPGDRDLAIRVAELARKAGFKASAAQGRGFDHGTWVPLMLLYPKADIPVVQLSVSPGHDVRWHEKLGQALAHLREEGILIFGSGSTTHNLHAYFRGGYGPSSPAPEWVTAFADWVNEKAAAGDHEALVNWERTAPHARENHPTPEHFLPLFVAMGAAGAGAKGRRIHQATSHGVLAMDAYAFG
jgi:4,5-DOPA dioxygenase extradiol